MRFGRGGIFRRLLLLVPTFLGITLVTFAIVDLAARTHGDPAATQDFELRTKLSEADRRRVREELRLDLPSIVNTDVIDQRRYVERLVGDAVAAYARLFEVLDADLLRLSTLQFPGEAEVYSREITRDAELAFFGRLADVDRGADDFPLWIEGPAVTAEAHSLLRGIKAAYADARRKAARVARLGGMGLVHFPRLLDAGSVSERGVLLLQRLARAASPDPIFDENELRLLCNRKLDEWTPAWAADSVAAWARIGATGDAGNPERERIEKEVLGPAGGIAATAMMQTLFHAEDPKLKSLGMAWMHAYAGFEDLLTFREGDSAADREHNERTERVMRDQWSRIRLRYRVVSDVERWTRFAWTETRYAHWLGSLLRLDFGESLSYRRPVSDLLAERLVPTLLLQGAALLLMYFTAVPLGVWSAVTRRRRASGVVSFLLFALYAVPNFWLATMAVLYLGDVFPVHGLMDPELSMRLRDGSVDRYSWAVISDVMVHAALPICVLAYGGMAVIARYARSGMLEVMKSDYIRTARAQGLSEWRVVTRHAMKNGLLPLVTLLSGLLPALVGGSIIVESIFNIPGMGMLAWESALSGDVPVAMGVITIVAILTMVGYLLADLLHGWLDPRYLRESG